MPTPAEARARVAAALEPTGVRVVSHYRHLDEASDPTALLDWERWAPPRTSCPAGPVSVVVTVAIPGWSDPEAQSAALDELLPPIAQALDSHPLIRGEISADSDDNLGRFIRIPVEVY